MITFPRTISCIYRKFWNELDTADEKLGCDATLQNAAKMLHQLLTIYVEDN